MAQSPVGKRIPACFCGRYPDQAVLRGEVQTVLVLVAIGVNREGYLEVLGVAEDCCENQESWRDFFRYLKRRGLERIRPLISGKSHGLLTGTECMFPFEPLAALCGAFLPECAT